VKKIGIIADDSSETRARVILMHGFEDIIEREAIVLIYNGSEENPINKIIGILRKGSGKNELLNPSRYRPDIAYAKVGGEPSSSREIYSFEIIPIGSFRSEEKLVPNRYIIQPRSSVYLFEENENPCELIKNSCKELSYLDAYLEGHRNWKVPADAFYIPYHVGVFGTTGTGKSWFTRKVLIPFYLKNKYKVLVLDWSGVDYVPYFKDNVIKISQIKMDSQAIFDYFADLTDNFYDNKNLESAIEDFVSRWHERIKGKDEYQLKIVLENHLREFEVDNRFRTAYERAFRRALSKVTPEQIKHLMGNIELTSIFDLIEQNKLVVIDMSGFSSKIKLSFFLTLSSQLHNMMLKGIDLYLALIIDEAPQYCPFNPDGIQKKVTEEIKNLAALGRKHKLNLTLIAQGIAGEIGINAAVRRNLNTNFYGRLHPLDASSQGGARDWLEPYGITADYLLTLEDGRFYFAGVMNPSPVPLLITYDI
jgi:DNA helicase HerA-like ATPase